MAILLDTFSQFFREHSESWLKDLKYPESAPHLFLMAFLQRIINGGGTINREYALGRKRVDLLIKWQSQRIVIELKILRDKKTFSEALVQTAEYMDISNATEGHVVIFDRDNTKSWDEKIYHLQEVYDHKKIDVWGM